MASNRRRHNNSVPVGALARTILIIFLVGIAGLGYVYLQLQIHVTGRQIEDLENGVKDISQENEVAMAAISSLESRSALQRRLDSGFIKMEPITSQQIVRLNAPAPTLVAVGGIQPVANQEIEK